MNSLFANDLEFRSALNPPPAKYGSPAYFQEAKELVDLSANLMDSRKMLAEFWTSETDPAVLRWMQFAEFIAERDHLPLDDRVKLFFVLSNAIMDADIATFAVKREYDSVRPATAIPLLFRGRSICAWTRNLASLTDNRELTIANLQTSGNQCTEIDGGNWIPYQVATYPTPPSPEYVSEISAESAAAARILELFTGSEHFGYSITFGRGSSKVEPGVTPAKSITLKWDTFTDALNDAGMATRYAGIQFARGDLAGRKLGRFAADQAWVKAQSCFAGSNCSVAPSLLGAANR